MSQSGVPAHVAIIMDGNGRWAKTRGLPKIMGHRAGVKAGEEAIDAAKELGVRILTLYTFSTENWKRPEDEVTALFGLLESYLDANVDKLLKNNMRFSVIGRVAELPARLREKIEKVAAMTAANSGLRINLALNYGGRQEIVDAARAIAGDVKEGALRAEDITESRFAGYLYTGGLPDPDLLIRTSGELRLSNFLLWQVAYAELYVIDKMWPDFRKDDFVKALEAYKIRQRRFGG